MFKPIIKYTMYLFIIILIIIGLIFMIFKYINSVNHSQTMIEQAKAVVVLEAKKSLGEELNILYQKFDNKNNICWLGCVNSKNTYAIMYIAKLNKYTTKWKVNVFSERKGANAASLFSINHSQLGM